MAPEQVRGLAVDHRADIFAFGAVLYEMLSGERAFKGETAADTMTAILTKEPPDLDTRAAGHLSRPRPHRPPLSREDAGAALPVGQRSRVRARDAFHVLDVLGDRPCRLPSRRSPRTARGRLAAVGGRGGCRSRGGASWLPQGAPAPTDDGAGTIHAHHRGGRRGDVAEPVAGRHHGGVRRSRVNGSWDIYSQRVGGRNATPIVNDPQRDEGGPAFSPDGSLIAFHESDDAGGIFVAGATGESVRRVTDIGFDPAWSPDGKQIAFTTEEIADPASRLGDSTLYVVDVGRRHAAQGGRRRRGAAVVVAVRRAHRLLEQHRRSARHLHRRGGRRHARAGDAGCRDRLVARLVARRTLHLLLQRSRRRDEPVADRGRSVERAHRSAPPEPVTTGVQASAGLPRFSKDGSRLVFRSRVGSVNPVAIPFDPATLRAGAPVAARHAEQHPRAERRVAGRQSRSRTSASASARRISSSARRTGRCGASPTMRRAIGRRCSRPTADRSSSTRTATATGRAWTIGVDGGGLRKIVEACRRRRVSVCLTER